MDSTTQEHPLDCHDEMVLLEHFLPAAVRSYINRFRFSEKAEVVFITKAPAEMRQLYINYYGLYEATQKEIIDQNLVDAAKDFIKMRRFFDDDYLLEHASDAILRPYISLNVKGLYISEVVVLEIIASRNEYAFKVLMYRFYHAFKKKSPESPCTHKIA